MTQPLCILHRVFNIRHTQLPAQQLRQERVAQGGERAGFEGIGESPVENGRNIPIERGKHSLVWHTNQQAFHIDNRDVTEAGGLLIPRRLHEQRSQVLEEVIDEAFLRRRR